MIEPPGEVGLPILWSKQGDIRWEDWWVQRQGKTRTRVPGLEDHLGFLRYDLTNHGPSGWRVDERPDGLWLVLSYEGGLTDDEQGGALQQVLPYVWEHGFDVDYERWGSRGPTPSVGRMGLAEPGEALAATRAAWAQWAPRRILSEVLELAQLRLELLEALGSHAESVHSRTRWPASSLRDIP